MPDNKPKVILKLFYFDQNRRVYEMNGVKKDRPYYIVHFKPLNIIGENEKEFICEYGVINKRSRMYSWGNSKFKTYTEREMMDEVYVEENRHILCERVRKSNANVLRQIEKLLLENNY